MYSVRDTNDGPMPLVFTHMAICNDALRPEFTPTDWQCDPAGRPSRRYIVTTGNSVVTEYAWFEVIVPCLDDARTVADKIKAYTEVQAARTAVQEAERKLRDLIGW